MDISSKIKETALQSGLHEFGYVNIAKIEFHNEVRKICEGNMCRNYGTSWACPPAVGTIAECWERVMHYSNMALFSKKYQLEDSFDFEKMTVGLHDFKRTVDNFHQSLKEFLPEFLLLSNEGCDRCDACTYPDEPCRFPDMLHHSLEGYGFIVSQLASEASIRYNNGKNTVTYFGALLF